MPLVRLYYIAPLTISSSLQVQFAESRKIGFLAQGGRHGYAPELQKIQNGILINLEQLDHIRVDNATGIATVGGGTVYQQVIDAVYAAGREMSTRIRHPLPYTRGH